MNPDPAIFVLDLQDVNHFSLSFSVYYHLKVHFSKKNVIKKSQNSRNQGFSYYFCLMIEGSGSRSVPLTIGSRSGSKRPKTYGSGSLTLRTGRLCTSHLKRVFACLFCVHRGNMLQCHTSTVPPPPHRSVGVVRCFF
jgi:hypothetical protein